MNEEFIEFVSNLSLQLQSVTFVCIYKFFKQTFTPKLFSLHRPQTDSVQYLPCPSVSSLSVLLLHLILFSYIFTELSTRPIQSLLYDVCGRMNVVCCMLYCIVCCILCICSMLYFVCTILCTFCKVLVLPFTKF